MLDGVSLDQLRTFIAAADEGSFSAAGRRLRRAQSVVSQTLANLEGQLRVKLFDRSARFPVLTDQGRALLADARAVAGNVDLFKARAKSLAGGLEPKLSAAVDVMFPPALFTAAVVAFQQKFPSTLLNFDVESSAVVEPVLNGRCGVGVVGSWSIAPPQLTYERLLTVRVPMVVSSQHPLAKYRGPIPAAVYAKHVLLTHVDPADISRDQGFILKPRLWRLSHLETKLAFLRAGLGYAGIPLHMIEADLASGELVQIRLEDSPADGYVIAMSAIYRTDSPPGPAGRWFIDFLKQEETPRPKEKVSAWPPSTAKLQNSSSRRSLAKRKGKRVVLRHRGGKTNDD
jgi:DNA-binding transcriptional LysR family regulator